MNFQKGYNFLTINIGRFLKMSFFMQCTMFLTSLVKTYLFSTFYNKPFKYYKHKPCKYGWWRMKLDIKYPNICDTQFAFFSEFNLNCKFSHYVGEMRGCSWTTGLIITWRRELQTTANGLCCWDNFPGSGLKEMHRTGRYGQDLNYGKL